jgi:hypothetical protein
MDLSHIQLVQQFLEHYNQQKAAQATGPDPTLTDLTTIEDQVRDISLSLQLTTLSESEKDSLKGKRMPDMADLMFETAAGLRACPQIQKEVDTPPEYFEMVATQDLTIGGLSSMMQTAQNGADTGLLLRAAEADQACAAITDQIPPLLKDPAIDDDRKLIIRSRFADPLLRRKAALEHGADAAASMKDTLLPAQERLDKAKELNNTAELVRELVMDALAATSTTAPASTGKEKGGHSKGKTTSHKAKSGGTAKAPPASGPPAGTPAGAPGVISATTPAAHPEHKGASDPKNRGGIR